MAASRPEQKKLSKSILTMKFMKKSKEKICKEQEEERARPIFASEEAEALRKVGIKFIIEPSFVPCEGLINGRISYHGMNAEIERLSEEEKAPKERKEEKNDMEITDLEMAHRYSSLVGTISNKFKKKSEKRSSCDPPLTKRAKFMKPGDD